MYFDIHVSVISAFIMPDFSAEREKTIDRPSRREEDYRGSPTRDRSPKSSGYGYKSERTGD